MKQVIVVRKDLNMRKGKIAAQVAHASLKVFLDEGYVQRNDQGVDVLVVPLSQEMSEWITGIFTKICVSVDSEQELLDIYQQADDAGLHCSLIQDAGNTEFHGIPTYTTVAIGPNKTSDIDTITKHLKLL